MNAASSRIRFFKFLEYLPPDLNYRVFSGDLNCDIFYIQKNAREGVIELAKKSVAMGIPIVYDIDDDFNVWPGMHEIDMLNMASAVTTDTDKRAIYLRNYTKTPVYIVPDALDYVHNNEIPIIVSDSLKKVTTFGNIVNIECTADYFNSISKNYTKEYIGPYHQNISGTCVNWYLSTFLQVLKTADVAVLIHPMDNKGDMKSNNRLIVCMSIGLPTIVSDTSAYADTLKKVDCEFLIAKTPGDVNNILTSIESPKVREEIGKKFYKYAWDNFSPQMSSSLLSEIFKKVQKQYATSF